MEKPIDIIRLDAAPRQRWYNNGGWTREITRGGSAEDWDWRLSVAEVEADGPFSRLPGIEREIFLLEGEGMRFDFEDGEQFALTPETPRLRFDGARALDSRLMDGPTRDFNLMWRRDRVEASMWRRPLVGSMVMFAEVGETWAIHMLAGEADVTDDAKPAHTLARGDTALATSLGERLRVGVVGAGEALVIRLAPLAIGQ